MRKLHYIILIGCCLCAQLVCAQRRYMTADLWENRLGELSAFSSKDVSGKTDAFWGLHTSQYVGSHHLFGFSAEGSWSTFLNNMPKTSIIPGGGAAGLKLLYEYQYSGILFQTGIGVTYQRVFTYVGDTSIYHYHMHDTWAGIEDEEFTLKHQFYDRCDMAQQIYGQVPLYVGHYIVGSAGVGYWLAGVHFNYSFWGNTHQSLTGSTLGKYERYLGIWQEMDNHGFRKDVPIERTGSALKLQLDIVAHGEIGYEYTTYQGPHNYRISPTAQADIRLRFGAFIDMGILNINPGTNNVYYGIPDATIYDFPTYRMDHVFSTQDAKQYWMRNIFVGLRFTFFYGFQTKEHCILCDPWNH